MGRHSEENFTMDANRTRPIGAYPGMGPMSEMVKLYLMSQELKMYLFPCLLAGGLQLNIISVLLFMRTKLRKVTTMHYFIACGITDSIYLCAALIPWLEVYEIRIYHTEGVCQIVVYLRHLSEFLSSWYLALALLDTWIGGLCSLNPKRYCTVFKTRALILGVFKLALVALLYLTWTYGPLNITGRGHLCEMIEQTREAVVVLRVMEIIFVSFCPSLLIFVLAILLSTFYCRCRNHGSTALNKESIFIPLQSQRSAQSPNTDRLRVSRLCLTTVCLILGLFFMLITVPRSVSDLLLTFLKHQSPGPPSMELIALLEFTDQLYNIHFAWKFFIYFFCLKQFRSRLCKCFSSRRKRGNSGNKGDSSGIVDGEVV